MASDSNALRLERDSKICQLEWRVGRFGGSALARNRSRSAYADLPNADGERHRRQILQALLTLIASLLWISHAGEITTVIL